MKRKLHLKPIILLGAGRSGTKFLRDVLGASKSAVIIPYDVNFVWRYSNEKCSHDEFTPNMLSFNTKEFINKILPQLALKDKNKQDATVFIEKSVSNTLRPGFVNAAFPGAKYIHLIRDGRAVTESSLRVWQTPPSKTYLLKKLRYFPLKNYKYAIWYIYNLIKQKFSSNIVYQIWGPRYDGIEKDVARLALETVCARQWKRCIETTMVQLSELDQSDIIHVKYEDLMKDSQPIKSICEFIGFQDIDIVVDSYDMKVNKNHMEKWRQELTSEQLHLINQELEVLNKELGYGD